MFRSLTQLTCSYTLLYSPGLQTFSFSSSTLNVISLLHIFISFSLAVVAYSLHYGFLGFLAFSWPECQEQWSVYRAHYQQCIKPGGCSGFNIHTFVELKLIVSKTQVFCCKGSYKNSFIITRLTKWYLLPNNAILKYLNNA